MALVLCGMSLGLVHLGHHVTRVLGSDHDSNATTYFYKYAILDRFDGVSGK